MHWWHIKCPSSGQVTCMALLSLNAPCLPLRGSVSTSECVSRAAEIVEQVFSNGQPVP